MNLLKFIDLQDKNTIVHRIPIPVKMMPFVVSVVGWYVLDVYTKFVLNIAIILLCGGSIVIIIRAPRYALDILVAFLFLYLFGGLVYYLAGYGFKTYLIEKRYWFVFLLAMGYSLALVLSSTNVIQLEGFLRSIRIPRRVTMAIILAYNLIPLVYHDVMNIIQHQKARGLELSMNPIRRVRQLVSIYIPALFVSLSRAQTLKDALKARGY